MKENLYKYANLLINRCLSIKEKQPLLISAPIECYEFVRIISEVACEAGVNDIFFDWNDDIIKHNELKYFDNKDLKNSSFFNKSIFDKYAKKKAGFLMLYGDDPNIMNDIESDKIAYTGKIFRTTRPLYKKMQLTYEVPWCIACIPTLGWAKKIFPNSKNPINDLWNIIFELCLVNTPDPIKSWNDKIEKNNQICKKINALNITKLHYKNNLGTNLEIGYDKNIWLGAGEHAHDGRDLIVNMPTEEIFTSPNKYKVNGIVHASKPLIYNNSLIDDFYLEFKDGKVINYDAKIGKDILKSILDIKNGNYLGETALVSADSPISKSNLLFYETLYDENASCHLALGEGFVDAFNVAESGLDELGLNKSKTHVDFMIGTNDMEIIASTKNGEIIIMKDGNITL